VGTSLTPPPVDLPSHLSGLLWLWAGLWLVSIQLPEGEPSPHSWCSKGHSGSLRSKRQGVEAIRSQESGL
jgi:hypothetical protein